MNSRRGFTLIELMVALCLLSIIVGALFSAITGIGRAQASTAGVNLAQSGLRAGIDMMSRDIEMASAAARSGTLTNATGAPATVSAITVTDSATGPDRIDLYLVDAAAAATLLVSFGAAQSALTVDSTAGFKIGDTIQLSDLVSATLLTVTAFGTNGGNPTLVVTPPTNALPRTYPPGAWVFRSRSVSYYIDSTVFGATDPLLMYDPDGPSGPQAAQPVAEGIEDLQIALGFDLDGNGSLSSLGTSAGDDEWIGNVAGETAPPSLLQLRALRLTLVARPTLPTLGNVGRRPAAEDHPAAPFGDAFPRRVLQSQLTIRNFNL